MGDFTLGCLLGQYDKAQSFDMSSAAAPLPAGAVGSWALNTGVASFSFVTDAHSSGQSIFVQVASLGTSRDAILRYSYNAANDAYARWFPDVTTHQMELSFWAYATGAVNLFDINIQTVFQSILITNGNAPLQPYHAGPSSVVSGSGLFFIDLDCNTATPNGVGVVLDDFLLRVDPITLHPEYEFQAAERAIRSQHRTLGGQLHTYTWDKYGAWNVPLRYLPTSHADLLNWWWQQGFNLAFTLDTSDSESIHICRIVNERQPIGGRERPYADLWNGALQLEAINDGTLAF